MCARWSRKELDFDPRMLIEQIASSMTVEGENVSFKGWMFEDVSSILAERMDFKPEIPILERPGLFWKALVSAAKNNQVTEDGLEKEVSNVENEYLKQSFIDYVILTNFSLSRKHKINDYTFDGCKIRFHTHNNEISRYDYSSLNREIEWLFNNRPMPSDYTFCTIDIRARSTKEAQEKAYQVASLSRALMNLVINRSRLTIGHQDRPIPINQILSGPFTTIHFSNGQLASDLFWFEPSYTAPSRLYESPHFKRIWNVCKLFFLRIIKSPFRERVSDALLRYNSALDKSDYDVSIIELWSILEALTGDNSNSKLLIQRVAFPYKDHDWARVVLSHLCQFRNRMVHNGRSSTHRNQAVNLLRKFVEDMIVLYINNDWDFKKVNDIWDVFSTSSDKFELQSKIDMLNLAKKIKGYI